MSNKNINRLTGEEYAVVMTKEELKAKQKKDRKRLFNIIGSLMIITGVASLGVYQLLKTPTEALAEKPSFEALQEQVDKQTEEARKEAEKAKKEAQFQELELEQLELEKKQIELKKQIESVDYPDLDFKIEEPKKSFKVESNPSLEAKKVKPVVAKVESKPVQATKTSQRSFRLNNGKYQKGSEIISYVKSNANGKKFWNAFNKKYGSEVADKIAITLFYENGTLWEKTVGVCSAKYQIGGDYRNCNYADINSNGLDSGLLQINTWYQRKRIAKLGGPSCTPQNSRDRADTCNKKLINWLHNPDNNLKIAMDIYSESGLSPWYGAKKAGVV